MPLLALGLPTGSEQRWLVKASAGDDVSEEAEQARKDVIDVAGKTVPADERVQGEVATASKRRPEDTDGAFIVCRCCLKARTVCSAPSHARRLYGQDTVCGQDTQQQLPDTNRARQ